MTTEDFVGAIEKVSQDLKRKFRGMEDLDDAVQGGLLLAWAKRDRHQTGNLAAWIYKVACNAILDIRRAAKREKRHAEHGEVSIELAPLSYSIEALLEAREILQRVARVSDAVPEIGIGVDLAVAQAGAPGGIPPAVRAVRQRLISAIRLSGGLYGEDNL